MFKYKICHIEYKNEEIYLYVYKFDYQMSNIIL